MKTRPDITNIFYQDVKNQNKQNKLCGNESTLLNDVQ